MIGECYPTSMPALSGHCGATTMLHTVGGATLRGEEGPMELRGNYESGGEWKALKDVCLTN